MKNSILPEFVLSMLSSLNDAGFEAFIVGGAVRDILLGTLPHDWDIATSALPADVQSLFERTLDTGIKHGTVTVHFGSGKAEVTTFRTESVYSDRRHPDRVDFVSDLKPDLSRRDFTINAMAMSAAGELIDYFGGASDLENGVIHCVGDPRKRFEEDALRMLRAFRLKAVFGFEIERHTLGAIRALSHLAAGLSAERVRDELIRIILSERPETLENVIESGLLNNYLKPAEFSLDGLKNLRPDENVRFCALCHLLLKSGSIFSVRRFLTRLRFGSKSVALISSAVGILESVLPRTEAEMKRLLRDFGSDAVSCAAGATNDGGFSALYDKVLAGGECYSLKQLAVTGSDIEALGFHGREVGSVLSALLDHVIDNPNDNERSILLSLARTAQ